MAINTHSDHSTMSEINVTPLVDVMLVLLIVFIITAPLLMQAVKINLPKTAPAAAVTDTRTLQISVDAAGKLYLDRREITLAELEPELRQLKAKHQDIAIQLHADDHAYYGQVAKVLALVQHAGISKLAMVTAKL